MTSQHGGSRPVVRKDDGRLKRKLGKPVRVTVIIEQDYLDRLKEKGNIQDIIRGLIKDYLEGI